ncbi:MAG: GMC family oxidoreductase [Proteobacteria bacterium]|nr:GMC family oxidoreductase [Pseudomonadota bacterium]MBU1583573.1 GMC family oxidoreductase [Pseudomonadota bacterium]MBU2453261.1 GMC family oxidoreductase [Pseudomonadota bacterium]MBU2629440.1 GMC family oxidoreductase [Pseudomonadota bacterium]
MKKDLSRVFDFIFVGAGISGPFIANDLCQAGCDCLMLEAGKQFTRKTYPTNGLDGTSQLYWSGGLELGHDCKIAFLRPKVVGGGSIVNQALVDRFDEDAFASWKAVSGVDFFTVKDMDPWYDKAESEICIQEIPAEFRNKNAQIFEQGFKNKGYQNAPLRRAQSNCRLEEGNCCIECLNGCRLGSKQSTPETVLKKALENDLTLVSQIEVVRIIERAGDVKVIGKDPKGGMATFRARNLVLAGGAIGNARLLLNSKLDKKLPRIGHDFYCHPQFMSFGRYDEKINSHLGAFQAFKSDDKGFRKNGFKLENVYAGPEGISLLIPGFGKKHHEYMEKLSHFACIEVCTRDTAPGQIRVNRKGKAVIKKVQNAQDLSRQAKGTKIIEEIFSSTGAREIVHGQFGIGLHLMGCCPIGTDSKTSVIDPEFRLHGSKNIFCADSSIFPNAPGINPSLTIMALSKKASASILRSR